MSLNIENNNSINLEQEQIVTTTKEGLLNFKEQFILEQECENKDFSIWLWKILEKYLKIEDNEKIA